MRDDLLLASTITSVNYVSNNHLVLAILIEAPELGAIENRAADRLAGLAPIARDQAASREHASSGAAAPRSGTRMPALGASRFNPDLKTEYQVFIQVGKPQKLALTAIMRKLLIIASTLIQNSRTWTPKHPLPIRII